MDWGSFFREWGPLLFAAVPNIVLAAQWAIRKEFATTDALVGVHKVLDDQHRELADSVKSAHHRIDLMAKDIAGLPGYDTTNEIKKDLVELREEAAASGSTLQRVANQVDRLDEFLRTRP